MTILSCVALVLIRFLVVYGGQVRDKSPSEKFVSHFSWLRVA